MHFKYARVERRLDLVLVDRDADGERSLEAAVGPLDAQVVVLTLRVFELALAFDGEGFTGELDVDVLLLDARQVGLDYDLVVVLEDVDNRLPLATS